MANDKGEGGGTKPSSEAKGVAKIQNDTVKAREAEAKDISPLRPDKKEVSLPSTKFEASVGRIRFLVQQNLDFIRRRVSCVCGFGFLIAGTIHTCSIAARAIFARLLLEQDCGSGVLLLLLSYRRYHPYLLDCC